MFSCKDVTELASRRQDEQLPLGTRLGMRLHVFVCVRCARYVKHLDFIRRALSHYRERAELGGLRGLSGEGRNRILEAIKRETGPQD